MTPKLPLVTLGLLVSSGFGLHAIAQANVSETEPVVIYVNGQTGLNSNVGSSTQPLKTVQAAVNLAAGWNAAGKGVKIILADGVYRESVTVGAPKTIAPTTIEAENTGKAFIDGADILANGRTASSGVVTYPWTDTVTGCSLPSGWYTGMPPVVLANEMVFIDGAPLTQVVSASQLRIGTFFVNQGENEVEIYPFAGVDMNSALVEISDRRATLTVNHSKNLVLRGLVLQHAASCMNQTGASVSSSTNVLLDTVQATWNNWSGLGINSSTDVTVENSTGSYNGGAGLSGYEDVDLLWQNNEADYNNWRGAMVGLYDFAQSGVKLMRAHTATVSGQIAYNNIAQGLWFDTDNTNVTISGAKLVGNIVANLQLEANQGPITLENSNLCSGSGLQLINTADFTMTGNNLYNNGGTSFQNGQLFLAGNPGGRVVQNWETGQETNVFTSGSRINNNSFIGGDPTQYGFNTYLSGTDWSIFLNSLESNDNNWYSPNASAFVIPNGRKVNLGQWHDLSGQDGNSTAEVLSAAAAACTVPAPSYADFQLLARNAASYISAYAVSNGSVSIPLQLRSFGYGMVQLSVSGLPSGVTASFSSSLLSSGASVLTLTASKSAGAQTVPVTVIASGKNRVHTLTVWVAL